MSSAWQHPPRALQLSSRYIDIWRVTLDLPPVRVRKYHAMLSGEELERCARFKSEQRRREFIIGRGMLRMLIGKCLDQDPAVFDFSYSEHQKPYLHETELGAPVGFNLTHSHDLALIALTLGRDLGIDLEYLRYDVEFKALARRFFSKQESQSIEAYSNALLPEAFFACWTRKEALLKALGEGIAFGLRDFSVNVDPRIREVALETHWDPAESTRWSILNLSPGDNYTAAVAASGGKFELRCWDASAMAGQ